MSSRSTTGGLRPKIIFQKAKNIFAKQRLPIVCIFRLFNALASSWSSTLWCRHLPQQLRNHTILEKIARPVILLGFDRNTVAGVSTPQPLENIRKSIVIRGLDEARRDFFLLRLLPRRNVVPDR